MIVSVMIGVSVRSVILALAVVTWQYIFFLYRRYQRKKQRLLDSPKTFESTGPLLAADLVGTKM